MKNKALEKMARFHVFIDPSNSRVRISIREKLTVLNSIGTYYVHTAQYHSAYGHYYLAFYDFVALLTLQHGHSRAGAQ